MKTLNLYAVLFISIFAVNFSFAQTSTKKETIKVWGNCGMCKTTIEKAARKAGATAANWNEDSKELNVTYVVAKTNATKIQEAIANAGYDTQDLIANDKAYNNLHGCCKYERKSTSTEMNMEKKKCCDNMACGTEKEDCKDKACCKDKSCCKS